MDYMIVFSRFARRAVLFNSIKDVWAGFYVIRSFLTHEITYRPFAITRPNCKPARTLKIFNIYFQRNDRKAWLHKQGIFLNSIPAQLFSLI